MKQYFLSRRFILMTGTFMCLFFLPNHEVFAATIINSDITVDTTWTLEGSPYVIEGVGFDGRDVADGVTLTIEPGVVVKFIPNLYFNIHGDIIAEGEIGNEVVFTAYSDDEYGGDTDGAIFSNPSPGYWREMYLSGCSSVFNNVIIRYGGTPYANYTNPEIDSALRVSCSTNQFSNIKFENNSGSFSFPYLFADEISINNITVINDVKGSYIASKINLTDAFFDVFERKAIKLAVDGEFTCIECTFLNGYEGIHTQNSSKLFISDSIFENFENYAIHLDYPTVQQTNSFTYQDVHDNQFIDNGVAVKVTRPKNSYYYNNSFIDNDVALEDNSSWEYRLFFENNWWGDISGPYSEAVNGTGLGDEVVGIEDSSTIYPWLVCDIHNDVTCSANENILSNLAQYKIDGSTIIEIGETNRSNRFIFKGRLEDVESQAKMQVELKEVSESFDGTELVESDLYNNGETAEVKITDILPGSYKWRARLVSLEGIEGVWVDYNEPEGVDFISKPVPHYTQNISPYPSSVETDLWDNLVYAQGKASTPGSCGLTIAACGCALTSAVMVMRYNDIIDRDGIDINPGTLNTWLEDNGGYFSGGALSWYKISEYTEGTLVYDTRSGDQLNNFDLLDEYLSSDMPAIVKMKNRGKPGTHFVVLSNKLDGQYEVIDPAWYNTITTNDGYTSQIDKVRDYQGSFDGLRLFSLAESSPTNYTVVSMSSPADIVVTDSLGRRAGYDSYSGIEYREIPGSSFVSESYDDPESDTVAEHEWKSIYIKDFYDTELDIKVVGTGEGSYALEYRTRNAETIYESTYDSYIEEGEEVAFDIDIEEQLQVNEGLEIQTLFDYVNEEILFDASMESGEVLQDNDLVTVNAGLDSTQIHIQDMGYIQGCDVSGFDISKSIDQIIYNGVSYNVQMNVFAVDWQKSESGELHQLQQVFCVSDMYKVRLTYHKNTNMTQVKIRFNDGNVYTYYLDGIRILNIFTDNGDIKYEY